MRFEGVEGYERKSERKLMVARGCLRVRSCYEGKENRGSAGESISGHYYGKKLQENQKGNERCSCVSANEKSGEKADISRSSLPGRNGGDAKPEKGLK